MATSIDSASDTITSEGTSTSPTSDSVDEIPPSSGAVPAVSSSESPQTDSGSTEQTDDGPETPAVLSPSVVTPSAEAPSVVTPLLVHAPAERAHEGGCCHRFLLWTRGIPLAKLCGILITSILIFVLILASFLSGNLIVILLTAVVISLIVVVFFCYGLYKLIQRTIGNRQSSDTETSDQERGTSSPSENLQSSSSAQRVPEPVTSSIESETSCHQSASKSPSRQEKPEPSLEEKASTSKLSTKSDELVIREEESVRQRHKSNEKTE